MKFELNIDSAIEVLEKNLAEHVKELKDASEVWTGDVVKALEDYRDALDRRGLKASHDKLSGLFYKRPVDTRSQYSKYLGAIKQAKKDGQLKVTVDEDDYDRIYNDNWEWRVASKASNAGYTSRKR